jgi:hypothetical protein
MRLKGCFMALPPTALVVLCPLSQGFGSLKRLNAYRVFQIGFAFTRHVAIRWATKQALSVATHEEAFARGGLSY